MCVGEDSTGDTEMNKQFMDVDSQSIITTPIPVGTIVKVNFDGDRKVCIVTKEYLKGNGKQGYQVRPLNDSLHSTVSGDNVQLIQPDPADIPESPEDLDPEVVHRCLTNDDLQKLWDCSIDDTVSKENRVTLYWHHRLRHLTLIGLKKLAARGLLPKCILKVKKMPLCAACAFAKAHRKNWRFKGTKKGGKIRSRKSKHPGDGTSCDHIVSQQPGLTPQSHGKLTHARYWGSVLYCDDTSDFLYNHLVEGISSEATLESKLAYERVLASYDRKVKSYHADNLRFNDSNFTASCIKGGQHITFCGVGAHHQNGIAEAKVKEVSYAARTLLLHAKRKWPTVITTVLWPYALQAAVDSHNRLSLDEDGLSPLEKLAGTGEEIIPLDFHTWGCPVYILEAQNQSGGIGTPKWDPRSHIGIYLGHSPCHAGSVALVLNLKTGLVSPQFHVVFDDEFTTVPYLTSSATVPPNWPALNEHSTEQATNEEKALTNEWLHPPLEDDNSTANPNDMVPSTNAVSRENSTTNELAPDAPRPAIMAAPGGAASEPPATVDPQLDSVQNSESTGEDETEGNTFVNLDTLGLRHSGRKRTPSSALKESDPKSKEVGHQRKRYGMIVMALSAFAQSSQAYVNNATTEISHCYQSRMVEYGDYLEKNFDGTSNKTSPFAHIYLTSKANNECYNLKEMMKEPDRDMFMKAMEKEVASLFKEEIWKMVPKSEMIDHYDKQRKEGKVIKHEKIMMIWSFKRKRHPDGTLDKHKARLCCHGGQQQWGVNYWDTYAPVVSWSSVRILMTIAKLHNLHTKSVDFVQAYPQALVKSAIYLHPPAGVILNRSRGDMVLKLIRNLYGLKDSGNTWFKHLTEGLEGMGFKPTESGP